MLFIFLSYRWPLSKDTNTVGNIFFTSCSLYLIFFVAFKLSAHCCFITSVKDNFLRERKKKSSNIHREFNWIISLFSEFTETSFQEFFPFKKKHLSAEVHSTWLKCSFASGFKIRTKKYMKWFKSRDRMNALGDSIFSLQQL